MRGIGVKKNRKKIILSIILTVSLLAGRFGSLAFVHAENGNGRVADTPAPSVTPTDKGDITPGADDVTPTPKPTNTPTPKPTDIPVIIAPTAVPVLPEEDEIADAFRTGTYEDTSAYFVAGYRDGIVFAEKDADTKITSPELNEWAFMLYVLSRTELPADADRKSNLLLNKEKLVTVTSKMLETAGKRAYPVLAGLKAGDKISLGDLITMFMMTRADDAREALVSYVAGNETKAVSEMNRTAKAYGMKNTRYRATDGAYNADQYTTPNDLYCLFNALMCYETFANGIEKSSMNVKVTRGSQQTEIICTNSMFGDVLLYGEIAVPEGFTFRARLSGACQAGQGAQVMFVTGPSGLEYVTVIANIPFEKDLAIESSRLLELKGEYFDAPQELPLGDDEVRYKYLLDAPVVYYTIDNRPYAYMTQAMTDRYMMDLTVPVWRLNENTGERYPSTATVPIHRKLYISLKSIMEEVYALPVQFPIKVFKGYGYRRSGGVGLSNCTLISVHSYGAAVDINLGDYDNDYYLGKGNDLRNKDNPYCIPDEVIAIFEAHGWFWGGNFNICADTMHFQYLGLDYLSYQDKSPFVTLDTKGKMDVGILVDNLQTRLKELGFNVQKSGIYNNKTRTAVMKFQAGYGLPVTGEVDYKTWETLINATHYLPYVF